MTDCLNDEQSMLCARKIYGTLSDRRSVILCVRTCTQFAFLPLSLSPSHCRSHCAELLASEVAPLSGRWGSPPAGQPWWPTER